MTIDAPAWESLLELDESGEVLWSGGDWQPGHWLLDAAVFAWREVESRAGAAYEHWCREPGPDAYAAYRALQDQADAAQSDVARGSRPRPTERAWGPWVPRGGEGSGPRGGRAARAGRRRA
jgi:hypothetical protein